MREELQVLFSAGEHEVNLRFMAEPLKSFFSPALVCRLAADVARVHPPFPARSIVKQACAGLKKLELLDRGKHIAVALAKHLPPAYPDAIDVLLRSLGTEHATDELEHSAKRTSIQPCV